MCCVTTCTVDTQLSCGSCRSYPGGRGEPAPFQYSQVIKPIEGLLEFHSRPNKFSKFNAPFPVVSDDDVRFYGVV